MLVFTILASREVKKDWLLDNVYYNPLVNNLFYILYCMKQILNYYPRMEISSALPKIMTAWEINKILETHTAANNNKYKMGYADITPSDQWIRDMLWI